MNINIDVNDIKKAISAEELNVLITKGVMANLMNRYCNPKYICEEIIKAMKAQVSQEAQDILIQKNIQFENGLAWKLTDDFKNILRKALQEEIITIVKSETSSAIKNAWDSINANIEEKKSDIQKYMNEEFAGDKLKQEIYNNVHELLKYHLGAFFEDMFKNSNMKTKRR